MAQDNRNENNSQNGKQTQQQTGGKNTKDKQQTK
jgi:hypothetical protein